MMPEMNGYEVITRLKADEKTREIPVIFLTAKVEVEDEQLGLELGAVDYITKPIDFSPCVASPRIAKCVCFANPSANWLANSLSQANADTHSDQSSIAYNCHKD
jgi:CheY-like chemotaxis protein